MSQPTTLINLAESFSVEFVGDGNTVIEGVADIMFAAPGSITFLTNKKLITQLQKTKASAVILRSSDLIECPKPALISDNPHLLFAQIADFLHPDEDMHRPAGISPAAYVADSALVHPSAHIAAHAVIEEHVVIGSNTYIGPGSIVRERAKIGAHSKLVANVTVCMDSKLGNGVIVHPSAVIGSDGFGLAYDSGKWIKVPQLGAVIIGNNVEIGAGVAIDRGALKDTIIEDGVKLDNQIHVAHNVVIGENTAMAAQSGVAGSSVIGKNCEIGGAVGILGHLQIADKSRINAFSTVYHTVKEPGDLRFWNSTGGGESRAKESGTI